MNKIHSELVGEIRWSEIAYPWQMEVVRTAPMPGVEEFRLHLSVPMPAVPPEFMFS